MPDEARIAAALCVVSSSMLSWAPRSRGAATDVAEVASVLATWLQSASGPSVRNQGEGCQAVKVEGGEGEASGGSAWGTAMAIAATLALWSCCLAARRSGAEAAGATRRALSTLASAVGTAVSGERAKPAGALLCSLAAVGCAPSSLAAVATSSGPADEPGRSPHAGQETQDGSEDGPETFGVSGILPVLLDGSLLRCDCAAGDPSVAALSRGEASEAACDAIRSLLRSGCSGESVCCSSLARHAAHGT